jgi:hypothetical protein
VPAFALKAAFGEMGVEMFAGGAARAAGAAAARGLHLRPHPTLEPALQEMLGRAPLPATAAPRASGRIELAL